MSRHAVGEPMRYADKSSSFVSVEHDPSLEVNSRPRENAVINRYKQLTKAEIRAAVIAEDKCPECGGELDTGWECNKCGFDARPEAMNAAS